ncbi:MAG: hypothetical protein CFE24_12955 [Flavobacterium sp. BFFFF2]|nr:MAG: hypothetical protein CFE24_12955 [Flavobacterium sp. BFFFF2]
MGGKFKNYFIIAIVILLIIIAKNALKQSIRENASNELERTYTPTNNSSSLDKLDVSNELPTKSNITQDISVPEEPSATTSNPEIKTEEITDQIKISRKDTETWILSKLTSYSMGTDLFFNFNYSFRDGYLVCEYDCRDKPLRKYCRVSIPIDDFSKVEESHDFLVIHTNGKTMKRYFYENKKEIIDDSMPIAFNFEKEPNLTIRLQKAFLHLKSFYKKSSHEEAF